MARRILILSDLWQPFPGGAERLAFNIGRFLHGRGNNVIVLTGYEHAKQFDGPPVVINLDMPLDDEGEAHVEGFVGGFKPDVILTHHVYARAFEPFLARCGIPVVQVVLNGSRMASAALAVFISEYVRRAAYANAEPGDLTITPPALDDVIADGHANAVGFIKPIPHKGVEFFYKIARAMPTRRFVVLRGEWQNIEIIEHLPNVEFMEPVADIRDFWRRVNVVLVPSLIEDAGTVAQEAAVNGVPCISSYAGGLPETNLGGVLLKTKRVDRWVRAIAEFDNATHRRTIVANQLAAYRATDHVGKLAALAERVEAL